MAPKIHFFGRTLMKRSFIANSTFKCFRLISKFVIYRSIKEIALYSVQSILLFSCNAEQFIYSIPSLGIAPARSLGFQVRYRFQLMLPIDLHNHVNLIPNQMKFEAKNQVTQFMIVRNWTDHLDSNRFLLSGLLQKFSNFILKKRVHMIIKIRPLMLKMFRSMFP